VNIVTAWLINLPGWIGAFVLYRLSYTADLSIFALLAMRDWVLRLVRRRRDSLRTLTTQMIFTGIDALPTVLFLALATGFIFTFRLILLMGAVGTPTDMANALVWIIGMLLGPMISAIILISRTGSAIVVDIGNMKLHREIEGLELLGININDYLVAPRIVACVLSQLAIAVLFTLVTLVSGFVFSGLLVSVTYFDDVLVLHKAITPAIVFIFVVKNLIFGYIIGTTACFHGLSVKHLPNEVPQQTQRAIVNSLIHVFMLDGIFALIVL
jgi:phospholipid/cholesterol/gamma-HCH transport system permease protein